MRIIAPSPLLAPFVRELMVVEVREAVTRLHLPEPGLVLGIRYRGGASLFEGGGERRLPDRTLTGMRDTARRMRTSTDGGVVLVRFRPGGAARFFAEPLNEIFGATLALDELVRRPALDRLQGQVVDAANDAERAAALEAFLTARLRPTPPDPVVDAAVRALEESHGALPISTLARRLAVSQDPLEKRFRRAVGATPKQLAKLLRVRHALATWRPGVSLTRLAVDAGYFDQSHFSREVRAVTGQPPGQLLRTARVDS